MGNNNGCGRPGMTGFLIKWIPAYAGNMAASPLSQPKTQQGYDADGSTHWTRGSRGAPKPLLCLNVNVQYKLYDVNKELQDINTDRYKTTE